VSFRAMFYDTKFDADISGWDTHSATNMDSMFQMAGSFKGDLSEWCVSKITELPKLFNFAANSAMKRPKWGTCPRGEDQ